MKKNRSIQKPSKGFRKILKLQLYKLPQFDEIHRILKSEHSSLYIWVDLALKYYKKGNFAAFVELLESSLINADLKCTGSVKDQMRALDMLAAYYMQTANREKDINERNKLFEKATQLNTTADTMIIYDTDHLLVTAFICLLRGDKIERADKLFNLILSQSIDNIPAQLGIALIEFNRKNYRRALFYYKNVLCCNPKCPADVRLGLAHCFLKLRNIEKAQLAFQRALELDANCVSALVGLAIMKINTKTACNIKQGILMFSKAYTIDNTNPIVLNHLSNHYFFKKDYTNCLLLAKRALLYAVDDTVRAESYYYIARVFHVQHDYKAAYQYYFQASHFGPVTFVLPHFGLGQMYMYYSDIEKAIHSFEKVLKVHPGNYESIKFIGLIYAYSENQEKRFIAKNYLKRITEHYPEDVEAWIELANILKQTDIQLSLLAYTKATDLLSINITNNNALLKIFNNVAALNYRLGNIDESRAALEKSLDLLNKTNVADPQYDHYIKVTTTYNLARVYEIQCQFQKAEELYKNILKEHPNYIDCYLRLGCMARDCNYIYEASSWFKKALDLDYDNTNAWLLLGNLHISKKEWRSGQQKFEYVLTSSYSMDDSYALIAMGNIWLHKPIENKHNDGKHLNIALKFFKDALIKDPKNIWAANGIGCVLAHQGYLNEASAVFTQIREVTADICDVWLNIANIYFQKKYFSTAIQMYEECIKRFIRHDSVEVLQYLGNAYYKNGNLKKAKNTFLKVLRISPQDTVIMYNINFVLQKSAIEILKYRNPNPKDLRKTVYELQIAHEFFKYLSIHGDGMKYDVKLVNIEASHCQHLLNKALCHLNQAQLIESQENPKDEVPLKHYRYSGEYAKNAFVNDSISEKAISKENQNSESNSCGSFISRSGKVDDGNNNERIKLIKRKISSVESDGLTTDSDKLASKKTHSETSELSFTQAFYTKNVKRLKASISSSEEDINDSDEKIQISGHSLFKSRIRKKQILNSSSHFSSLSSKNGYF